MFEWINGLLALAALPIAFRRAVQSAGALAHELIVGSRQLWNVWRRSRGVTSCSASDAIQTVILQPEAKISVFVFMPAAKSKRLKTFKTRMGLYDWVVAAPSQKAALKAWDTHIDLFATGAAETTTDARAVKLAMQSPGTPIALELDGNAVEALKALDVAPKARPTKPKGAARPAPKVKKPDRSDLNAAEKAAKAYQVKALRERKKMEDQREQCLDALDAKERKLDAEGRQINSQLKKARDAFEAQS